MTMEIRTLGHFDARIDGHTIAPQAGKPRQILALLCLNIDKVVPVSTIIDEIWGDNPPISAKTTLQTYVMQIRRMIAAAAENTDPHRILVTWEGGYQLVSDVVASDARDFRARHGAALAACRRGDHEAAAQAANAGLDMWRGPFLVDVAAGLPLAREQARMEGMRAELVDIRFDAELALGNHYGLVAELAYEVSQQPMNESLCGKYVLALYRTGRQDLAHEALRALRAILREELGVEPSRATLDLQTALLRSDPGLDWAARQTVAA